MKIADRFSHHHSLQNISDEHLHLGKSILENNLKTSKTNSIVIVTDPLALDAALIWFESAKQQYPHSSINLYILEGMTHSGQEPPSEIIEQAAQADLTLLHTHFSLTHTQAGKAAIKNNGVGASLPGVTKQMMLRTLQADYPSIYQLGQQLQQQLQQGSTLRITSPSGTDVSTQIRTSAVYNDGGIIHPGNLGNLPAGEVFFAPLLGSTHGSWVVEASLADEPELAEPITLSIKDGKVIKIDGDKVAQRLYDKLSKIGSEAFNVAEIGIGTNPATDAYGDMIEAEKTLGTAHLAVGNSSAIGGEIDVPIHLDALTLKPTIIIDDRVIANGSDLHLQV